MPKLHQGQQVTPTSFKTIHNQPFDLPANDARLLHVQFRRFAGCPVCNYHLHRMAKHHAQLTEMGIKQLVFFHSSQQEMLKYQQQLPFACVADPDKTIYRQWGVEKSRLAILHPSIIISGTLGFLATGKLYKKAENGILGLPADFLLNDKGKILEVKYGKHADDQWEIDELLDLIARHSVSE